MNALKSMQFPNDVSRDSQALDQSQDNAAVVNDPLAALRANLNKAKAEREREKQLLIPGKPETESKEDNKTTISL